MTSAVHKRRRILIEHNKSTGIEGEGEGERGLSLLLPAKSWNEHKWTSSQIDEQNARDVTVIILSIMNMYWIPSLSR